MTSTKEVVDIDMNKGTGVQPGLKMSVVSAERSDDQLITDMMTIEKDE